MFTLGKVIVKSSHLHDWLEKDYPYTDANEVRKIRNIQSYESRLHCYHSYMDAIKAGIRIPITFKIYKKAILITQFDYYLNLPVV